MNLINYWHVYLHAFISSYFGVGQSGHYDRPLRPSQPCMHVGSLDLYHVRTRLFQATTKHHFFTLKTTSPSFTTLFQTDQLQKAKSP